MKSKILHGIIKDLMKVPPAGMMGKDKGEGAPSAAHVEITVAPKKHPELAHAVDPDMDDDGDLDGDESAEAGHKMPHAEIAAIMAKKKGMRAY